MSFLELPLVLARDIIEMVAERLDSCKGLTQFLQLRLVDRFFEREITRCIARGSRSFLDRLIYRRHRSHIPKPVQPFQARLLFEYLGDEDRRTTHFDTKMHAVVDVLVTISAAIDEPMDRLEALGMTCEALVRGNCSYWSFNEVVTSQKPYKAYAPSEVRTYQTSFVVAITLGRKGLVRHMLAHSPVDKNRPCQFLGSPLAQAIRSEDVEMVQMLLDAGASTSSPLPNARQYIVIEALEDAASAGHAEVIDIVLAKAFLNNDASLDERLHARGLGWNQFEWACDTALRNAFLNEHAQIAKSIIGKYWTCIHKGPGYLREFLLPAAQRGQNELVKMLLELGVDPNPDVYYDRDSRIPSRFPLHVAAQNEHVSTCKILLDGNTGKPERGRANVVWRYVAASGNKELRELFEEYRIPTTGEDLNLLPIAAYEGQLEMAEWIVARGLDKIVATRKKGAQKRRRTEALRRFCALILAVVYGHTDLVCWLVHKFREELVSEPSESPYNGLKPMILATDAGRVEMVNLLLGLGYPIPKEADFEMEGQYRDSVDRTFLLDQFGKSLDLTLTPSIDYLGTRDQFLETKAVAMRKN